MLTCQPVSIKNQNVNKIEQEGGNLMAQRKLNIRFHNPNTNDEVAKLLVKIIAGQKANDLLNTKIHTPPIDKQ